MSKSVLVVNEKGLHMLSENEGSAYDLEKVYEGETYISAIEIIDDEFVVLGFMNGSVEIVNLKTHKAIAKLGIA